MEGTAATPIEPNPPMSSTTTSLGAAFKKNGREFQVMFENDKPVGIATEGYQIRFLSKREDSRSLSINERDIDTVATLIGNLIDSEDAQEQIADLCNAGGNKFCARINLNQRRMLMAPDRENLGRPQAQVMWKLRGESRRAVKSQSKHFQSTKAPTSRAGSQMVQVLDDDEYWEQRNNGGPNLLADVAKMPPGQQIATPPQVSQSGGGSPINITFAPNLSPVYTHNISPVITGHTYGGEQNINNKESAQHIHPNRTHQIAPEPQPYNHDAPEGAYITDHPEQDTSPNNFDLEISRTDTDPAPSGLDGFDLEFVKTDKDAFNHEEQSSPFRHVVPTPARPSSEHLSAVGFRPLNNKSPTQGDTTELDGLPYNLETGIRPDTALSSVSSLEGGQGTHTTSTGTPITEDEEEKEQRATSAPPYLAERKPILTQQDEEEEKTKLTRRLSLPGTTMRKPLTKISAFSQSHKPEQEEQRADTPPVGGHTPPTSPGPEDGVGDKTPPAGDSPLPPPQDEGTDEEQRADTPPVGGHTPPTSPGPEDGVGDKTPPAGNSSLPPAPPQGEEKGATPPPPHNSEDEGDKTSEAGSAPPSPRTSPVPPNEDEEADEEVAHILETQTFPKPPTLRGGSATLAAPSPILPRSGSVPTNLHKGNLKPGGLPVQNELAPENRRQRSGDSNTPPPPPALPNALGANEQGDPKPRQVKFRAPSVHPVKTTTEHNNLPRLRKVLASREYVDDIGSSLVTSTESTAQIQATDIRAVRNKLKANTLPRRIIQEAKEAAAQRKNAETANDKPPNNSTSPPGRTT